MIVTIIMQPCSKLLTWLLVMDLCPWGHGPPIVSLKKNKVNNTHTLNPLKFLYTQIFFYLTFPKCSFCFYRLSFAQYFAGKVGGAQHHGGAIFWSQIQKRRRENLRQPPSKFNFMFSYFTPPLFLIALLQTLIHKEKNGGNFTRKWGGWRWTGEWCGGGEIQIDSDWLFVSALPDHNGHAPMGGGRDQQGPRFREETSRMWALTSNSFPLCVGVLGAMRVHFGRGTPVGPSDTHAAVRMLTPPGD